MKDQDVSLDRRPREQGDLQRVERIVEKHPDEVEGAGRRPRCVELIVVEEPRNNHDLVENAESEQDDDDVVVESLAECPIGEKRVESEEAADEGEDVKREKVPESHKVRDAEGRRRHGVVGHGGVHLSSRLSRWSRDF